MFRDPNAVADYAIRVNSLWHNTSQIAGKVFSAWPYGRIYYRCPATESEQTHQRTGSPGGIERDIIKYLVADEEIVEIHQPLNTVVIAVPFATFLALAQDYPSRDGHSRLYLPYKYWVARTPSYSVPWLPAIHEVWVSG